MSKKNNNKEFKTALITSFILLLTSGVVYLSQCGFCNDSYYGEHIRHLNVRIDEDIGVPPHTKRQIKPKNSFVADHSLFCNNSASMTILVFYRVRVNSFY